MNAACRAFRDRLAIALSGPPELAELSWNEHLLGCADCRALLEAEEALEALLASLPEPRLPPALTQRVLARLAGARDDSSLDALLALPELEPAPGDLAGDVLAALRPHRRRARDEREDAALDRLLDRVPAPAVPAGLADRLLRGIEAHRRRPRPTLVSARPTVIAAAAALLIALGTATWLSWAHWPAGGLDGPSGGQETAGTEPSRPLAPQSPGEMLGEPSDELLASLDLLESWDLLTGDDLELALASLDPVDQVLLELEGGGI